MEDLFLLIVDRDCDRQGNVGRDRARESEHPNRLIACVAVHEVEVWMLALHKARLSVQFSEVRKECDPKERFADSPLRELGTRSAGRGRKGAMEALKGQWRSLRDTCTELRDLRDAIAAWRKAQP